MLRCAYPPKGSVGQCGPERTDLNHLSLKAKIEAVIYASEEPVTLTQLVGLLGQEGQAELDVLLAAQQHLNLESDPAAQETDTQEPASAILEDVGSNWEVPVERQAQEPTSADQSESPETQQVEQESSLASQEMAKREKERARRLRDYFRNLLDELIRDYASDARGLEVREVAGGFRLATKPEYHDAVRGFVRSLKPPLKLTLQALETLAVVAYKQPVTAPEVSEVRGVDSGGVLGSLMARKLITTAGRKQVIGRPILYKTTKDFLLRFGLRDIGELPSIEEFEKMAGELAEQEEIPMTDAQTSKEQDASRTEQNLEEEREAIQPQADGDSSDLDTVPVDGRISGLPPAYVEDDSGDPSAQDAEIQKGQQEEQR